MRIDLDLKMLILRPLQPQLLLIDVDLQALDLFGHLVERSRQEAELAAGGERRQTGVELPLAQLAHAADQTHERLEHDPLKEQQIDRQNNRQRQRHPEVEHLLEKREIFQNIRFIHHQRIPNVGVLGRLRQNDIRLAVIDEPGFHSVQVLELGHKAGVLKRRILDLRKNVAAGIQQESRTVLTDVEVVHDALQRLRLDKRSGDYLEAEVVRLHQECLPGDSHQLPLALLIGNALRHVLLRPSRQEVELLQ